MGILLAATLLFLFGCGTDDREDPLGKTRPEASPPIADPQLDRVILSMGDLQITNRDFQDYVQSIYTGYPLKDSGGSLLPSIFNQFVERTLILKAIQDQGFQVSSDHLKRDLKSLIVKQSTDSSRLETDYLIQRFLSDIVYRDVTISRQAINDYYREHRQDFKKKEQVLLYEIKCNSSQEALKIRRRLLTHPDQFEQIAREELPPERLKYGVKRGYFEKGTLPKVIEKHVFALGLNDISQIVESPYGFHIFRVTEKKRGQTLPRYQVEEKIRQKLLSRAQTLKKQEFIQELHDQYLPRTHPDQLIPLDRLIPKKKENTGDSPDE